MKKYTENLKPDTIYHVFNRGINGINIFIEDKNYTYFLEKYDKYLSPIADTFAYCLLKNHFHIALKIISTEKLLEFYLQQKGFDNIDLYQIDLRKNTIFDKKKNVFKNLPNIEYIINHQFAIFFNC